MSRQALFVVINSEGLENTSRVLASLLDVFQENPGAFRGRYEKFRVPWDDAYLIWCNLEIANMNFEDFVEEDEGDEQDWFTHQSIYEDDEEHQKSLERKEEKVREWRRLGHI
jgi:hypothetical protein